MIRPTEQVLKALSSLEGNADFETVLGWIEASREAERDAMELAAEPNRSLHFSGLARSLTELLRYARSARETLRKTG